MISSYLHELLEVSVLEESVPEVQKKRGFEEEWKVLSCVAGPVTLKQARKRYQKIETGTITPVISVADPGGFLGFHGIPLFIVLRACVASLVHAPVQSKRFLDNATPLSDSPMYKAQHTVTPLYRGGPLVPLAH